MGIRIFRAAFTISLLCTIPGRAADATPPDVYSGPESGLKILETIPISDFKNDLPNSHSPRELKIVLRNAIALTDAEKRGIPGTADVRVVPFSAVGKIKLTLPCKDGKVDWSTASGEIDYLGANRISYRGPLREDPAQPVQMNENAFSGSIVFPYEVKEPNEKKPRTGTLSIRLNLVIQMETHGYVPDSDPSIPFWRADKTKPAGRVVSGTWQVVDKLPGKDNKTSGELAKDDGSFGMAPGNGIFFPVQSMDLSAAPKGGLSLRAYAAPVRVDGGESQWAVLQLSQAVDLRRMNGLRLTVLSKAMAGSGWSGPAPVAAALAVRMKDSGWHACRTATPLLGGKQSTVVDFQLFERGTANPGYGAGPNTGGFLDLSRIDAVAVGVANPFGVGTVEFTALNLEAVRFREKGNGISPPETVNVTVDSTRADVFNGMAEVPKGLFGYHLANFNLQGKDQGPAWFEEAPIAGDGLALVRLCRPGFLRPLDHTSMQGEKGSQAVRVLPSDLAEAGDALDSIVNTVTNENLWARPRWMDEDLNQYTAGIREMFVQVGKKGLMQDQAQNTLRRIEFWNEPFMWGRHINRGDSKVSAGPGDPGGNRGRKAWNDPTQYTFIPGHLGAEIYAGFFNAAAQGLKEGNRHVQIGGMSSPAFGDDFCEVLKNYVGVFLEKSKDHLNFLTEHHYSGLPQRYAADYEIVTGYTQARFGKSWPIWNTEANDLDDIAPGDRTSPEAARAFTEMNRAYYNYRDILEMILKSRDKAAGRALHALWNRGWFQNRGEYLLYRHLAELRGTLVVTDSDDSAILPVAVQSQERVVVYLLNDSPFPRNVDLRLEGINSVKPVEASGLRLEKNETQTAIGPSEISVEPGAKGLKISFKTPLLPREIAKLVIQGVGIPSGKPRKVQQYFSNIVLKDVIPGKPVTAEIKVSREALQNARSAKIRLVARDVQTGEFKMKVGETEIEVPATTSEGTNHRVVDLSLLGVPSQWGTNFSGEGVRIELQSAADCDGFSVYTLSLLLEENP